MYDYIAELDGPQSYRTADGRMILCKGGGGGGGKGGVGKVLGVVASIAIPFAAPVVASAMTGVAATTLSTAVAGAGLGAVASAVTGGDPLKGAIMGGIGSGIGAEFGGTTTSSNPLSGMFSGGASAPSSIAPVSDVGALGYQNSFDTGAMSNIMAPQSAATGAVDSLNSFDNGAMANTMDKAVAPTSFGEKVSTNLGKAWSSATDPANLTKAGLQLGTNYLASAMVGNQGAEDYAAALNRATEQNQEVFAYNKAQQGKKNVIGDQMQQDTLAYNPEYYANQSANATGVAQDNAWNDLELRMRAQGRDDNYINAEKSRYGLEAGLKKASSYDSGYTQGINRRQAGLTTAGGMYDGIQGPASTVASYGAMAGDEANKVKAMGGMMEKAFGIDKMTDAEQKQPKSKLYDPSVA